MGQRREGKTEKEQKEMESGSPTWQYIYFIYLLNKDQNPAIAWSARINAKEREKKERSWWECDEADH